MRSLTTQFKGILATEKEIASNLYEQLLLGEKKATLIIAIAMPSEEGVFMGVMNRLKKSCGKG